MLFANRVSEHVCVANMWINFYSSVTYCCSQASLVFRIEIHNPVQNLWLKLHLCICLTFPNVLPYFITQLTLFCNCLITLDVQVCVFIACFGDIYISFSWTSISFVFQVTYFIFNKFITVLQQCCVRSKKSRWGLCLSLIHI